MTRVTSGPAEVVASGVATTWFGHGLDVHVDMGGSALRLAFTFAREGGEPRIETSPTADGWSLRLVDLDDPGRGSAVPVLIATIGADLVFLHVRVLAAGASPDRTLHWTIHRVPKATVDYRPADARPGDAQADVPGEG
jgi:hypothetical protein